MEYLAVLLQQESKLYPPCDDYLSERHASLLSSNDTDSVSESWRRKLCEWCYQVVDHFNVSLVSRQRRQSNPLHVSNVYVFFIVRPRSRLHRVALS